MDNKQILDMGIDVLKSIDAKNIENVDIDRTEYEDGSATISISVTAPAKIRE
ncbi:hypothetical protein [Planococcus sp. YIM B11945]|uniref:hypothetical protein n=1 Tax=Planococcus sp. YIM B11945 TaxID=3435410 RepID=UPI003D7E344B